jgi:hypothetical protein
VGKDIIKPINVSYMEAVLHTLRRLAENIGITNVIIDRSVCCTDLVVGPLWREEYYAKSRSQRFSLQ